MDLKSFTPVALLLLAALLGCMRRTDSQATGGSPVVERHELAARSAFHC